MSLKPYQEEFIELLLQAGALTFGDFVTKSGRATPYFINMGRFDDGEKITRLGRLYASHIADLRLQPTVLFGPAYKAIPLAVITASALFQHHSMQVGFAFNRKEAKTHGDKGTIVGAPIHDGARVVLVEDVITAGTTLAEIVPLIRGLGRVELHDVVVGVDRCERGVENLSACQEASRSLQVQVHPIVTIHQIVSYLSQSPENHFGFTRELRQKVDQYLSQYGVSA